VQLFAAQLAVAKAGGEVVVHQAYGLQAGMADGGTREIAAGLLRGRGRYSYQQIGAHLALHHGGEGGAESEGEGVTG
jgi:hypothetical protein